MFAEDIIPIHGRQMVLPIVASRSHLPEALASCSVSGAFQLGGLPPYPYTARQEFDCRHFLHPAFRTEFQRNERFGPESLEDHQRSTIRLAADCQSRLLTEPRLLFRIS